MTHNAADAVLDPDKVGADPDRPALLFHDETVSYAGLLARVNRFGNVFIAAGVRPENRVLLMLKDSPDLVAAYLGAIKIGAVAVALNVRLSANELAYIVADSGAAALVIDREFLPLYRAVERMPGPQVFVAPDLAALTAGRSDALAAHASSPDAMAFWIYTSGTTGAPKAAVHLHHDVLSSVDFTGRALGVARGDRLFATSKLFFAYSLGNCLFGSLRLGATTILHDGWPDSAAITAVVERHRPTIVYSVPTMYRNLLRDGVATHARFAGVRRFVSAGERLPPQLFEQWRAATGGEILDGMGTSETIYMILTNYPGEARPGSSGKPVPGVEAQLRDGVLWARMPSIADRYWNQQEKSRAVFVGEWFRTGDAYRVDADGYWYHDGRADDLLKISGQWVSPAEIEDAAATCAGVAEAAVVGVENADGLTRLAMFVVAASGAVPTGDSIHEHLRERLAIYKCPREIRFVAEIPRTATGKVQRFRLREELK